MTTNERLQALYAQFQDMSSRFVGYPVNQAFDYSELLPFLEFSANNVGDPFHESNFRMNTHEFEREVIGTFSRPDAHFARRLLGLRHLRRHRGQHVRPVPGARPLPGRHSLPTPRTRTTAWSRS